MSEETQWIHAELTPRQAAWYLTRTKQGDISWRAWGRGAWWKQISGGWIEWFDGEGRAHLFEWMPKSKQNIMLDFPQLPDQSEFLSEHE